MIFSGDIAVQNADIVSQLPNKWKDFICCNLEGPIYTNSLSCRQKAGPHIYNSESVLQFLKGYSGVINLANNHSMDYGWVPLQSTISKLNNLGLVAGGAGTCAANANKITRTNFRKNKISTIHFCEKQFGCAQINQPGVSAYGPWVEVAIKEESQSGRDVIVSAHIGNEMCPWPTPSLQELFRSFIEHGAKIVHSHHSHVPRGIEPWKHGLIIYGGGNFLVDPLLWQSYKQTTWSLNVAIHSLSNASQAYETIFTELTNENGNAITIAESAPQMVYEHKKWLEICNYPLKDTHLLNAIAQSMAMRLFDDVYRNWLNFRPHSQKPFPKPRIRTVLRNIIFPPPPPTSDPCLLYHLFSCQSHQQAIELAL
jgi:hypothetical protein